HHNQANGSHINSQAAWDITLGDSQVIVAVIDTGVEETHPDFEASRIVTGYNVVTGSNDPSPKSDTIDAHGTCCSGEIFAQADNQEGLVGVCPGCSLMGIKMMDGSASQTQISSGYLAIEYATNNGAWVLSNSWGIDEQVIGQVDIQPFYQAVQAAASSGRGGRGAVVVFASGNGNQAGQGELIGSRELQNMAEVMAIGGTDPNDTVVAYSDFGPNLAVVAPTGAIDPQNPFEPFDGPQILTTDTTGDNGFSRGGYYWQFDYFRNNYEEPDTTGNYTAYFNGTSAACPIAAGVVGLVFSANPELSGAAARRIVEQTADKVGGINYDTNGHDYHYGYGRVNAARAVKAAVYGVDNPNGSVCVENVNCEGGLCYRADSQDSEGTCVTPCQDGDDCEPNESCTNLGDGTFACLPSCTSDSDCEAPQLCLPGNGGDLCQTIVCVDGSVCPDGTACPVSGGTCTRTCSSDSDCVPPQLCLPAGGGDLCVQISCSTEEDCPDGTVCSEAVCVRPGDKPEGGGGCGCSVSTTKTIWFLPMIALLLIAGRRRFRG
ncbi:MAG: S8 family serine peptidase, partial [Deltaproteobacteria bacterium]|nr:S8 family serine peptidase [Deltaproteobacteria bacterium]